MLTSLLAALAVFPATQQQPHSSGLSIEPDASARRVELGSDGDFAYDVRVPGHAGRIERYAIDAGGQRQSGAWLDSRRREVFEQQHEAAGRMAPTLIAHLEQQAPDALVEVAFWLRDDFTQGSPGGRIAETACGLDGIAVAEAVRATRRELLVQAELANAPRQTAISAAVRAAGGEVVTLGRAWPVVVARVPAARVAQLARAAEVDTAYRSMPVWESEGDFAQGTLRTPTVRAQGLDAGGSVVKFLVNDTSEVVADNPYLPPINYLFGPGSNSYHATAVAGNVANHHPLYEAAAAGLPEIWSSDGTGDSAAPGVWMAAISAGIDFGNCSWWNFLKGDIEFLDRFFDYAVRNFGVMMFKSNGNQGNTSEPYGTTPGQGYNVTCTGNYNDANTVRWSDDAITSSSSYWNPATGHEKPEVASPGDGVNTTAVGGSGVYSGFGGTSSASPLTAGVATLLASGEPQLLAEMTTVKAVLMASAWHNVEGTALLSDKDGAGGVHAAAAWATVRDGQTFFQNVTPEDFTVDTLDVELNLTAGDQTRVVALWFSNPDSAYSTDVLEMDLDLAVLAPDGTTVATSASAVNPFEIASFLPATSGTYTLRLTRQRFDGVSEPLSVAWSSRSDAATARVALPGGTDVAIGTGIEFQVNEPYDNGGSAYAIVLAAADAPDFPLPGGFTLGSGFDATTNVFLNLPGATGMLDGAGQGGFSSVAPNSLSFVGLEFDVSAVVFEGPTVSLSQIETVSNIVRLTITN